MGLKYDEMINDKRFSLHQFVCFNFTTQYMQGILSAASWGTFSWNNSSFTSAVTVAMVNNGNGGDGGINDFFIISNRESESFRGNCSCAVNVKLQTCCLAHLQVHLDKDKSTWNVKFSFIDFFPRT